MLPFSDLDKMDSEKDEMNQADIAAIHHFYSRHISDLPDEQALTELFAQVKLGNITSQSVFRLKDVPDLLCWDTLHFGGVCGAKVYSVYVLIL